MPLTTISEVFGGAWGIVENRSAEIEQGSCGAFDRIFKEEFDRNFIPARKVALEMDCCESTARSWLQKVSARYVTEGNCCLYLASDAAKTKASRKAYLAEKEAKAARQNRLTVSACMLLQFNAWRIHSARSSKRSTSLSNRSSMSGLAASGPPWRPDRLAGAASSGSPRTPGSSYRSTSPQWSARCGQGSSSRGRVSTIRSASGATCRRGSSHAAAPPSKTMMVGTAQR